MSVILALLQGAKASVKSDFASVAAEEGGSAQDGPLLDWGPKLLQASLAEGPAEGKGCACNLQGAQSCPQEREARPLYVPWWFRHVWLRADRRLEIVAGFQHSVSRSDCENTY